MLELEHGFRIVDVHVQLDPDDRRRPRDSGDPESIEREMHQAGIVHSLVFSGPRDGSYLKANNGVARMSVGRPFDAVARLNGALDPGGDVGARLRNLAASRGDHHITPADVEQYAYDDRFAGFRLNPAVDGLPDNGVLEQLEAAGLPVLTHGGWGFPPETIEETLLQYDFPLVVSSLAGQPLQEPLMHRGIDLLQRHDQCYLDTAFVWYRDPLERAIMEHPDRVLFGSGAPATHPNVALMEILTLDVPEDAMRKVFTKNAARVIEELAP
jgi:hypothetical protein